MLIKGAPAPAKAKVRSPVWVIVLSTITLFVYAWFWWYFINRELRDLGRARGSTELGDNPALSVLAVSLGALIIVPPFISAYNTCKRIQVAQRLGGERELLNGWLALALFAAMFFVYIPFAFGYIQSELNKVWRNEELTDPLSPDLIHPGAMRAIPASARPAPAPASNIPAWAVPAPGVRDVVQPDAGAAVSPNWYPDPWKQARLRYWDGSDWTGHTAA